MVATGSSGARILANAEGTSRVLKAFAMPSRPPAVQDTKVVSLLHARPPAASLASQIMALLVEGAVKGSYEGLVIVASSEMKRELRLAMDRRGVRSSDRRDRRGRAGLHDRQFRPAERVMFVRATFAVAVIAVLLPHAFDPGRPASLTAPDAGSALQACVTLGGSETACRATLPAVPEGELQGFVFDRLRAIKASWRPMAELRFLRKIRWGTKGGTPLRPSPRRLRVEGAVAMSAENVWVVDGAFDAAALAGKTVYWFDLGPVSHRCGRGGPARLRLMCEQHVMRLVPDELVIFQPSGFFLVVRSCAGAPALSVAQAVNAALLKLFFGTDAAEKIAPLFRIAEAAEIGLPGTAAAPEPAAAVDTDPLARLAAVGRRAMTACAWVFFPSTICGAAPRRPSFARRCAMQGRPRSTASIRATGRRSTRRCWNRACF